MFTHALLGSMHMRNAPLLMLVAALFGCATPNAPIYASGASFCCESVGHVDGKYGYGQGCALADESEAAACSAVLSCPGGYSRSNDEVTCPL